MNALKINSPLSALSQRSPAWRGLLVSGCLMLGLAGCVTEYSGGTQMASDPDATLEKRVALARQYIGVGDDGDTGSGADFTKRLSGVHTRHRDSD